MTPTSKPPLSDEPTPSPNSSMSLDSLPVTVPSPPSSSVQKREVKAAPVQLDDARHVSKSRAQRCLRTAFVEARFQTIPPPPLFKEEVASGEVDPTTETWQVWCKGSNGRMVALVEVTAARNVLPLACLIQTFKRIGQVITVSKRGDIQATPLVRKPSDATPAP